MPLAPLANPWQASNSASDSKRVSNLNFVFKKYYIYKYLDIYYYYYHYYYY